MKIEKLKMTRMHNLFIIALSAMCVACGGKNQGRQQTVPEFAVITLQPETVKLTGNFQRTPGCRDPSECKWFYYETMCRRRLECPKRPNLICYRSCSIRRSCQRSKSCCRSS